MFDFLRRKSRSTGSVLFRGAIPPRLENFEFLKGLGLELEPRPSGADFLWTAQVRHPQWGQADLYCPRETPAPPRAALTYDPRLSPREVEEIFRCGSSVQLAMNHERENALVERKGALRLLRALMSDDGVCAVDHGCQRFWSRAALDEELAHDAALDIESLFILHAVKADEPGEAPVHWLHTHGLAELGYFDFDILEPSQDVMSGSNDLIRAIAFGIVEGRIEAGAAEFEIARPGGAIRMTPAETFQRRAPARFVTMRDDPGGDHSTRRCVVCEPAKRVRSRLFGDKLEPSRWLQSPIPEHSVIYFSTDATHLMAQRARGSYPLCRRYFEEFAEFGVKTLVKFGVPVDGGAADDREHLWFQATRLGVDRVDGVLLNEPWHIESLAQGQSYAYEIEALSDWAIFTPAGRITPVEGMAARTLRANRDVILKEMLGRSGNP